MSWKQYLPLHRKKKRYEAGRFIVEGVRLCREALRSGWDVVEALAGEDFQQGEHWVEFADLFSQQNINYRIIDPAHLRRLADTVTPQGIALIMKMPDLVPPLLSPDMPGFLVVVESVRDPGNVGTIIRSADWFGARAVILSGDTADPFSSKVVRGSMGSLFHLPVYSVPDLGDEIRRLKTNCQIVVSRPGDAQPLSATRFQFPVALLLGSEAQGISAELSRLADVCVTVPRYGAADSLNVGIAGSIIMYHFAARIHPPAK